MRLCIVDTWLYLKRYCTWYTLFILPLDTEVRSLTLCNYRTCESGGGNALWPQEACSDRLSAAEASRCWLWPQLLSVTTWRSIYGETSCQVQHTHTHTDRKKSFLTLIINLKTLSSHRVYHPASGRVLEVFTSQPGIQFYTANFLDGSVPGKGGVRYGKHSSFCLETQNWPDAVNQVWPLIRVSYESWFWVLKECCFSSRHWRKHFGRSH